MMCLNLSTHITHYRLRTDGALVSIVRSHLNSRANSIRKVLRDRRIVVEMGCGRTSVYSSETLRRSNVLMDEETHEEKK